MPDNNVKDKLVTLEALKLVNDLNLGKNFSELDSVPSEVSVSATDIIAMQVEGTTYKLPVSALASALKSTGNYITSSEVANDLTTSVAGKVLDARQGTALKALIDSLDLPDISEANENVSWKSAPIGISHYYYDELDASTTYGVPVDNCFVVVMRSDGNGSQSRGVALAFRWTRGSTATTSSNDIWISTLQDEADAAGVEWFAWTQISYDVMPISRGGSGANSAAGALSNFGGVSKTGDRMTGQLTIDVSHATPIRFVQTNGGGSYLNIIGFTESNRSQMGFRQYTPNGVNYEDFYLPSTTPSDTTTRGRTIVTDKNLGTVFTTSSSPSTANDNPINYNPGLYRLANGSFNTSYWPIAAIYGMMVVEKNSVEAYKSAYIICDSGSSHSRMFFGWANTSVDGAFKWEEVVRSTGGTMTGRLVTSGVETGFQTQATTGGKDYALRMSIGGSGNRGIFLADLNKWLIGVGPNGESLFGVTVPIEYGGTGSTIGASKIIYRNYSFNETVAAGGQLHKRIDSSGIAISGYTIVGITVVQTSTNILASTVTANSYNGTQLFIHIINQGGQGAITGTVRVSYVAN